MSELIQVHHVGARWGNEPFPYPDVFAADFHTTLYDADESATATLAADRPGTSIITECLAERDGPKTLYVTANAGGTSVLKPTQYKGSEAAHGIDFDWPECAHIVKEVQLAARSMDSLVADGSTTAPDFISLDTQGSEFYILQGADQTLDQTLGIISEVLFAPLYEGQKTFSDVQQLLASKGFRFIRFQHISGLSPSRELAPIGFRGATLHSYADALFLRIPDAKMTVAQLRKLSFFAIVFNCVELAVECWRILGRGNILAGSTKYGRFIQKLSAAYFDMPHVFQPLFSKILPLDKADSFSRTPPAEWPKIFNLPRSASYIAELRGLREETPTKFESVLSQHGFDRLADQVSLNRRDQSHKSLLLLGA